jgi:hypothetical protein
MRVSIPAERLLKEFVLKGKPSTVTIDEDNCLIVRYWQKQASSKITEMFCGSVACMKGLKNAYTFWLESLKKRGHSEDLSIDGRKVL